MGNGNIRDFINNRNKTRPTVKQETADGVQEEKDTRRKAESTAKKYAGMNEEQLMREMFEVASKNKRDGSLTADGLENFYRQAAPMLSPQQRNKLRSLINSLK